MDEEGIFIPTENRDEQHEDNMKNKNDKIEEPRRAMIFDSIVQIDKYYKAYGKQVGFGVCRRSSQKIEDVVTYVTFGCHRYGKSKNTSHNVLKPHPITKTNCQARICAKLLEDKRWCLSTVVLEHNHILSPAKSRLFRCNRRFSHAKRKLEMDDRAGIRVNKSYDGIVVEAGGPENLPFSEKDCRNHIEKVRRMRLGEGDGTALQNYFNKMQGLNSNFFHSIDLDEENRIKNIFWADARSRAAYEEFDDVITFDTTYLTNKYDIPFAPFVGVNHHGHSILLGCGLISREDTESFAWLFRMWLTCMNGKSPQAIITDQDRAMQNAIRIVFPDARHRWCLWHIMKKIPEKLNGYEQYESIKLCLHNVVYDSLDRDGFEGGWNTMIAQYSLENNEWLEGLYNQRKFWVPCFVKDYFWAGMSTTQRSESMNAFFDGYVIAKTSLKQFVEKYDDALKSKVIKEKEADYKSFNSWVPLVTFYDMEKQFQEAYTLSKFKEFLVELTSLMYCKTSLLNKCDGMSNYIVVELQSVGEKKEHKRRMNFEAYIIMVLVEKDIFIIPSKYILHRWRKNVKRRYNLTKVSYCDWKDSIDGRRFDQMYNIFHEVANMSYDSQERCDMVVNQLRYLKDMWKENDEVYVNKGSKDDFIIDSNKATLESRRVLSPIVNKCKGRPPSKRKQSRVEQIIKKISKKIKGTQSGSKKTLGRKEKKTSSSVCQTINNCSRQSATFEIDLNKNALDDLNLNEP